VIKERYEVCQRYQFVRPITCIYVHVGDHSVGTIAFSRLPVDLMPEIQNPTSDGPRRVQWELHRKRSRTMVTRPLESALSSAPGRLPNQLDQLRRLEQRACSSSTMT
jgi:Cu/Ag efflux pump CusA